jgi:hypothetical protein
MRKPVLVKNAEGDEIQMPPWYDVARHGLNTSGIIDIETGLYLAADGLPQNGPPRIAALIAAGETEDKLGLVDAIVLKTSLADVYDLPKKDVIDGECAQ